MDAMKIGAVMTTLESRTGSVPGWESFCAATRVAMQPAKQAARDESRSQQAADPKSEQRDEVGH